MPCLPNSGFGHWLTHQSTTAKVETGVNVAALDLAQATYTEVPLIVQQPVLGYPIVPDKVRHLRHFMYRNNELALHTVDPTSNFFVAPAEYPEGVEEAFGLHSPPSPYELAAALLLPPHRCFWGESSHREYTPRLACANSALKWWLLGIPPSLLGKQMSTPAPELLKEAIQHLCRTVRFRLWASAIDPRCLVTNRDQARVAASVLQGTLLPRKRNSDGTKSKSMDRRYDVAQRQIAVRPLLKAVFQGTKIHTIDRPLYQPGIVFRTKQDKLSWLRTPDNIWAKKARHAHEVLYKRKINAHRRKDQSWNQEHI